MTRKCKTCGLEKGDDCFSPSGYVRRDGTQNTRTQCKDCKNASDRSGYADAPEERKERHRKWYRRERFKAALIHSRVASRRYGWPICVATEEEIKSAFNGLCAICGVPESECNTKLHMDHSHETGEFRGWLCPSCNKMLGLAKDSPEILFNAQTYLESFVQANC